MKNTNQATQAATELPMDGIDWGVVEGGNTELSAKYPRLQWMHGNKQAAGFNKSGGLFIDKTEYPNFTGEGFEPVTFITREGDELEGFGAADSKVAVIRVKHQWTKGDKGQNVPLSHVLCVIKGCDDLLCISLKGPSKALDFQKAFNQHMGQNVALANRTRPNGSAALEPFALWFPLIAGEQHSVTSKDGKNTSAVTSPELFTPKTLDRDYVVSLWVGVENYKLFASFYRETTAWQNEPIFVDRNNDTDTPEFTGGEQNGYGRITPQQIEHLEGICAAKGLDIKELALTATAGESDNIKALSKDEARDVIEQAAAA